MELHLDRRLADRRFFPAVDIIRSGTRREELLYNEDMMQRVSLLRRMVTLISGDGSTSATERILEHLTNWTTNQEFLANLHNLDQKK